MRQLMDNDAGRAAVVKGATGRMKYIRRYQRISVAGLHSIFTDQDGQELGRVDTGDNRSDLFTKGQTKQKHLLALKLIGMVHS